MNHAASVLVPYPVDKAYDYLVPEGLEVEAGDYVLVPLSGREVAGVVWGEAAGDVNPAKLKSIIMKYSMPPMPEVMRRFIDWVGEYSMTPKGFVLKMALSAPSGLTAPKPAKGYASLRAERSNPEIAASAQKPPRNDGLKLTDKQQAVMDLLADGQARIAAEIAAQAGVSVGVVKGLVDKGLVHETEIFNPAPCRKPNAAGQGASLSEAQDSVAEHLKSMVLLSLKGEGGGQAESFHPHPNPPLQRGGNGAAHEMGEEVLVSRSPLQRGGNGFKAVLLDGVTGAGKTEVYFEAVAEALRGDKQVLILLPEIALSNAFLDRFQARFGCAPALWHSQLSAGARNRAWRGVAKGQTKVVVGARSALFLPYQNLGLIVVDEEHESAYKQEDGVIYHARDMAVVRANLGKFPIVLVSATPSLETVQNAWSGRYEHLHLPDRFGGARMPDIECIDMRVDKPESQHFISPPLKAAMIETLEKGEQVLLFLNRRGYAPLTLCRGCGHRMDCPRCTAWLVEHKSGGPPSQGYASTGKLQCHHCGFSTRVPSECPQCNAKESFAACGPGVERVFEEAKAYFPDANILMLASDTAENNEALQKMLADIREGRVDIIIGTQIIAKGHHFPNLTLVGVVDADLGLAGGELRAAERCYQLLHQVAGRAGREEKDGHRRGRVMLQTYMPDHRIMQALSSCQNKHPLGGGDPRLRGDAEEGRISGRDHFLEVEAAEREAAHMPPYTRLVGIIVAGRDEGQVIEIAKALGRTAPQGEKVSTLGPAPAPFARLRGKYRYRLLVQADKNIHIQKTIAAWVASVKCPSTVRIYIDIDPQSFL